jgi:protoheme IX farnesyltransferase
MGTLNKYLELTKPRVTALNVVVGMTCFVLAQLPRIDWPALALFGIAGYLAVGGCGALNSYYDRDLDKLMNRTARRAIPSGAIAPGNALLYGLLLLVTSLFLTYVAFGKLTFVTVSIGAIVYLLIYTLWLKRRSDWNVVLGGVSGSFAALSGWAATGSIIGLTPILVGLLDFLWTPGHLWGLAIAKVNEYRRAGIPMLSVTRGLKRAARYLFFFNVFTVGSSLLFPAVGLVGPAYSIIAVVSGIALLWRSWRLINSPSEEEGLKVFKLSILYLGCIMFALMLDRAPVFRALYG